MDHEALLYADPLQRSCAIVVEVTDEFKADTGLLSHAEKTKALRLRTPEAQRNFYARRTLLRRLLAHWSNTTPAALPSFDHNPFGKPILAGSPIHFNISHSKHYFAFYFGPGEGGIDIEVMSDTGPFMAIREEHFHPEEIPMSKNDEGFYTIWTRKEAVLKAAGTGLTEGLNTLDCSSSFCAVNDRRFSLFTRTHAHTVCSIALAQPAGPACEWYFVSARNLERELTSAAAQ